MYKLKNSGNYDYYDNRKYKNFSNNNDYFKDNEKLYEITFNDGKKILTKN